MLIETLGEIAREHESRLCAAASRSTFADVAAELLAQVELPPIDWEELQRHAFARGNYSAFADLNILAFQHAAFYVELLVWGDSSPDIHSHSFAGAFRVLSGPSVHASYSLAHERWRSETVVVGEVALDRLEVLDRGDVRAIAPGLAFLHGLYHCGMPSATVVVRTHGPPEDAPDCRIQYGMPPPDHAPHVLRSRSHGRDRRLHAIRALASLRPWAEIEPALVQQALELPPAVRFALLEDHAQRLSESARAALEQTLPEALRGLPYGTQNDAFVLRRERHRLRSERARRSAGLAIYSPDRESAEAALRTHRPDRDAKVDFVDGLVDALGGMLGSREADGYVATLVRDVLDGRDFDVTVGRLVESFEESSVRANLEWLRSAHAIVREALVRVIAGPVRAHG